MSHMNDLDNFDSSPPTIPAGESERDLGYETLDMKCEMRSSQKKKNSRIPSKDASYLRSRSSKIFWLW